MQLTVLHWQYIFLNNSLTLSHSNLTFKACWEAPKSRLHGSTFTQLSNHHCISTPGMYYSKTCIEQTFSQKYLPFTLSLPCAQLQKSWLFTSAARLELPAHIWKSEQSIHVPYCTSRMILNYWHTNHPKKEYMKI